MCEWGETLNQEKGLFRSLRLSMNPPYPGSKAFSTLIRIVRPNGQGE